MINRLLTGCCFFLFCGSVLANAPKIDGLWQASYAKSNTPSSNICIKTLSDGKLEGRIKKAFPRPGENPENKCTACPGDQKNKPFENLRILWGMKPSGNNTWDGGQLLDPETGKVYSGTMTLSKDGKTVDMRGYILGMKFLGATDELKRLSDAC